MRISTMNWTMLLSLPLLLSGAEIHAMKGLQRARKLAPSNVEFSDIGKFNILVLLVRFSDHTDRELPPASHFQDLCENQMRDYLREQSYGLYDFDCFVQDWRTTDNTEAFYARGVSGKLSVPEAAEFFIPILDQLNDEGVIENFEEFDQDFDGYMDQTIVIHSGYSATDQLDGASCGANNYLNRFWNQGGTSGDEAWRDQKTFVALGGHVIASAFFRTCSGAFAQGGVILHEWIHTFIGDPVPNGFFEPTGSNPIDTYDGSVLGGGVGGLGAWDIMALYGGYTQDESNPGSMSPFAKDRAGWISYTELTVDATYLIRPSEVAPDYFLITAGFPEGEALVIENRQPIGADTTIFGGEGGLLIYHWDENMSERWGQWSYPGSDRWPDQHYRFRLIQADGRFDLEKGSNNGDEGDMFKPGMTLGPSTDFAAITPDDPEVVPTHPNTDTYFQGPSGIRIFDIQQLDDGVMSFQVTGILSAPTASPNTLSPVAIIPSLANDLPTLPQPSLDVVDNGSGNDPTPTAENEPTPTIENEPTPTADGNATMDIRPSVPTADGGGETVDLRPSVPSSDIQDGSTNGGSVPSSDVQDGSTNGDSKPAKRPPPAHFENLRGTAACSQLSAGDISIWALNADDPDEIAFLALKSIPDNVEALYLTDSPYTGARAALKREGVLEYLIPEGGIAVNKIFGMFDNNPDSWPSVNGTGIFNMSSAADNVFLFCLDADNNLNYLFGMTWAGEWVDASRKAGLNRTMLPPALTDVGRVAVSGFPNWQYSGPQSAEPSEFKAAMSDAANWEGSKQRFNLDQYKEESSPSTILQALSTWSVVALAIAATVTW